VSFDSRLVKSVSILDKRCLTAGVRLDGSIVEKRGSPAWSRSGLEDTSSAAADASVASSVVEDMNATGCLVNLLVARDPVGAATPLDTNALTRPLREENEAMASIMTDVG